MLTSESMQRDSASYKKVEEFKELVDLFKINKVNISVLLEHDFSKAMFEFFRNFPLKYNEEHTHLTGAVNAEFIFPRLKKLLDGPNKKIYEKKIKEVYGPKAWPIKSVDDVDK